MSYYMCPCCYKVYDGHFLKSDEYYGMRCPDMDCASMDIELFEIDELMVIPIRKLNALGYITKYCCSGHTWDNGCAGGYIMFEVNEWFPMVPSAPKGWYLDGDCIRFKMKYDLTPSKKRFLINKSINELIKWCDTLPAVEYDE